MIPKEAKVVLKTRVVNCTDRLEPRVKAKDAAKTTNAPPSSVSKQVKDPAEMPFEDVRGAVIRSSQGRDWSRSDLSGGGGGGGGVSRPRIFLRRWTQRSQPGDEVSVDMTCPACTQLVSPFTLHPDFRRLKFFSKN